MFGSRTACILSGGTTGHTLLSRCADPAGRPAVEDWLASLETCVSASRRCGLRHNSGFVNGPGASLGNNHAPRGNSRRGGHRRDASFVRLGGCRRSCRFRLGRRRRNLSRRGRRDGGGFGGRNARSRCMLRDRGRHRRGDKNARRRGRGRSGRHSGRLNVNSVLFLEMRLFLERGRRRRWFGSDSCSVQSYYCRGRSYHYDGACCLGWGLGHNRPSGRVRSDCRSSRRRHDDGRRRTRLRDNFARSRVGRRQSRRRGGSSGRCSRSFRRRSGRSCRLRRRRLHRHARMARFFLFFFPLGLNGLQHVAWLGDVREVDLRRDGLRSTSSRGARMGRGACCLHKARTYLFRLVSLQRTGVSLDTLHAEFGKKV